MSAPTVMLATPCYGGVCVNYLTSVIRLTRACDDAGVPLRFEILSGESLVTRARNEIVARFLDSDADRLLFVDADVGFDPWAAIRLIQAPHAVVAGAYPLKGDGAGFPIDTADLGRPDAAGFREARYVTTGFLCVVRGVVETLIAARPDLKCSIRRREGARFIDTGVDAEMGEYLCEDYFFCDLWRSVGGRVFIDPTCNLSHEGSKVYSGRLSDFLGGATAAT